MRSITTQLTNQLYSETSEDVFLTLLELTHSSWSEVVRIVNNTENIVHQGNTYQAFAMEIVLPPDDVDSERSVSLRFDNTGLDLVSLFRSISSPIKVNMKMVLASNPDVVQLDIGEMEIKDISYTKDTIDCKIVMDDFLNTGLLHERYTPVNFRGIF